MKKGKKRGFISIYFSDAKKSGKNRRDLTVVFDKNSIIYKKCKKMGSLKIKETINIYSYRKLVKKAKEADRSLGNFIKHKLKKEIGEN